MPGQLEKRDTRHRLPAQFFRHCKGRNVYAIKRCFITGVSPVTMDDLTSGFNIGTNYTLNPQFNEMTGFTEKDVRDMLEYYSTTCPFNHSVDELIELIAFLLRNADHQRNA